MNNTLPITELAAQLALRENLSIEEARAFVDAYFNLLQQGITNDRHAEAKGLGRFEVTDNTVTFTPDAPLAAEANAPFEMFAPIGIDGDVDIESIGMAAQDIAAPTVEQEAAPTPTPQPEINETSPVEEEETPITAPEQPEEPAEDPEDVVEEEITEEEWDKADTGYNEVQRRPSTLVIVLIAVVALLAGLALGIFAGYAGRDKIDCILGKSQSAEPTPMPVAQPEAQVQEVDTMPVVITDADIAEINDPTLDPEAQEPTPPVKEPVYDTITTRRFLTTMAKHYYGHQDYWVYIYQANADILRHPDRIKPGTRVVIPDMDTYRTSDEPDKNRDDARKLGLSIYARYK